jgi:hypothetical protein
MEYKILNLIQNNLSPPLFRSFSSSISLPLIYILFSKYWLWAQKQEMLRQTGAIPSNSTNFHFLITLIRNF